MKDDSGDRRRPRPGNPNEPLGDSFRSAKAQNASTGPKSDTDQGPAQGPLPSLSLPKAGGAIRGMGEKFAVNPATGAGSLTVPVATSPGRSGFGPELSLSYDSGSGNGP